MGQLLTLIIRIICGERLEKSSESEYTQLWVMGIFFAIFSIIFYFDKLNFDLPESFWGVLLSILLFGLCVYIFGFLTIIFIPKKILMYIGCFSWILTTFLLSYMIYIRL